MSAIDSMPATLVWVLILAFAIVTYLLRASFVALFSYYDVPDTIQDHLHLVAPAVLAAVALPPLFYRDGAYHFSMMDPFLAAGLSGAVAAWRTESLVWTMAVGLLAYAAVTVVLVP